MGFLTKQPNEFECLSEEFEPEWYPCIRKDVCALNLPPEKYRPRVVDPEYVDNWESPEKFDLLCMPPWMMGLLGAVYYGGTTFSFIGVTMLTEGVLGKKTVLVFSLIN